jgi:hypothetical protein
MLKKLTYANVAATAALIIALTGAITLNRPRLNPTVHAASTLGTWFIAGTFSDLPACFNCEVSLAPSGVSTMGAVGNTSNELLSPNVPIVASNFSVHIETPPGAGTRKFFLTSHSDISHSLNCTITGTNTTCNSGSQTLKIAPGTRLYVDVPNIGNAPATKLQLSWLGTP